jgi:hypothetical protein
MPEIKDNTWDDLKMTNVHLFIRFGRIVYLLANAVILVFILKYWPSTFRDLAPESVVSIVFPNIPIIMNTFPVILFGTIGIMIFAAVKKKVFFLTHAIYIFSLFGFLLSVGHSDTSYLLSHISNNLLLINIYSLVASPIEYWHRNIHTRMFLLILVQSICTISTYLTVIAAMCLNSC